MKFKIRTPFNSPGFEKDYELNTKVDRCIPDQTMSIRQIMDRYARGLPLDGVKTPIYDGEDSEHPDMTHWDLAEKEAYMDKVREELAELKQKIASTTKAADLQKLKQQISKELQEQAEAKLAAAKAGAAKPEEGDGA